MIKRYAMLLLALPFSVAAEQNIAFGFCERIQTAKRGHGARIRRDCRHGGDYISGP